MLTNIFGTIRPTLFLSVRIRFRKRHIRLLLWITPHLGGPRFLLRIFSRQPDGPAEITCAFLLPRAHKNCKILQSTPVRREISFDLARCRVCTYSLMPLLPRNTRNFPSHSGVFGFILEVDESRWIYSHFLGARAYSLWLQLPGQFYGQIMEICR